MFTLGYIWHVLSILCLLEGYPTHYEACLNPFQNNLAQLLFVPGYTMHTSKTAPNLFIYMASSIGKL